MRNAWMALLVSVLLAACGGGGDNTDTGIGPLQDTQEDNDAIGPGDAHHPGPDVVQQGGLVMELFGVPSPTQSTTEAALPVRVRIYDPETASLASGVPVEFTLSVETQPPTGTPNAVITETMALTGDDGAAETVLRTGTVSGVVYRVDVSAQGADNDVSLIVQVGEQPTGDLRVILAYEGDNPPVDVRVLLLNQVFVCDGFNPGAPPEDLLGEFDATMASGEWIGEGLTQSGQWVVMLIGEDVNGSIVSSGCRSEVRVVPSQRTDVTVTMYPVGLHLPGIYDFTETVDLSAALPNNIDQFVNAMETGLADPTAALTTMAEDIYTEIYREPTPPPADAADAGEPPTPCHELWEADYPGAITGHALTTPGWLDLLTGFAGKAEVALGAVTVDGEIEVTGAPPGPYAGAFEWDELSFSYDGQGITLTQADWESLIYVMRLASEDATFDADVDGYDHLVVNEHMLKLEPGRIVGYLLLYHALEGVGSETATVQDLVKEHFDCRGLVQRLSPETTTCLANFQISNDVFVERCEQVAMGLIGDAVGILEGWIATRENVTLSGEATVVDADQDLAVDSSTGGSLTGQVVRDDANVGEATATFSIQ